jgi:hypothetical protein
MVETTAAMMAPAIGKKPAKKIYMPSSSFETRKIGAKTKAATQAIRDRTTSALSENLRKRMIGATNTRATERIMLPAKKTTGRR